MRTTPAPTGVDGGAAGAVPATAPKVDVDHSRCISCAGCVGVCPVDTITLRELHLAIDQGPCISCGLCIQFCPVGALTPAPAYGIAPPAPKPGRVVVVA